MDIAQDVGRMLGTSSHPSRSSRSISFDDLARLDVGELVRLYRESTPLRTLAPLAQIKRARLLALAPPLDRRRGWLVPIARHSLFPWQGKRIEIHDDRSGAGINRFRVLGERFSFRIEMGRSVLDSERCVIFDYEQPDNPAPIRRMQDELREASPGVYFGPALVRTSTEPKLLLFFALGS
jgi:hypothetical protein